MRNVALSAAVACLLAACEPPPPSPSLAGRASSEKAVTETQATSPAPRTQFHVARPLHEMMDSIDRVERELARTRGIVTTTYVRPAPRELSVINDTVLDIRTVARVRFYPLADGGWTDTIWTREPDLYSQLVRATNEDYGLPVLSVHGEWAKVIYAFTADGEPRTGWAKLVQGRLQYHDVDRQLMEYTTSLHDPENTEFFSAPDGERVLLDLRPSYTLQVLRIHGDWIQVAIMRPDTSLCTGDERLAVEHRDTVWIRRFNAQGKRQLWAAVAGC